MNTEMNGKKIRLVTWPDSGNEQGRCLEANENKQLHLDASFHGDRDEFWVIESNSDGKEIARHNPKFIETLIWAD